MAQDTGLIALLAIFTLIVAVIIHLLLNKKHIDAADKDAPETKDDNTATSSSGTKETARKKRGALDRMAGHEEEEAKDTEDRGDVSKKDLLKEQKKAEREQYRREMQEMQEQRREELEKKSDSRRKKEEEKEAARLAKEEEERKKKEEEEKRLQEEYEQWKHLFAVDTTGSADADIQQESSSLLQEFIDHIKQQKVVVLEELANQFGMKTQEVINRLKMMEQMSMITGVMDDKGKFIYITEDEMRAVAACIKRRGRMSISDLALESNRLVDLEPKKSAAPLPEIDLDSFDAVVEDLNAKKDDETSGAPKAEDAVIELTFEDLTPAQ